MQVEVSGKALVGHLDEVIVTQVDDQNAEMLREARDELSGGKLKKPPTAYFLFMMDHRKDRQGVSMKDIAAIWGDLEPEEKQVYIQKANHLKEEYHKKLQLLAESHNDDGEAGDDMRDVNDENRADDDGPLDPNDLINAVLPLGRIKAIAKLDPEISEGVRAEAWKGLQQATFQFLSDFLRKAIQEMLRQKKKKLMPSHLLAAADQEAIYSWLLQANIWGDELPKYQKDAEAAFLKKKERFSTPQKEERKGERSLEKVLKFSPKIGLQQDRVKFPSQALAQPTPTVQPIKALKELDQKPRVAQLTSFFSKKT